ncbi:MAG: DsrE/DsrF/DrsH-like family protein [Planctomycetaceae bacterium]|nr:DsrE/DsrF/DrsH-like family protein [Planctomycetales bacterium]MCB9927493.1 DsrE/DsrF/DrsH-like family protein [Planctomycetaceae bacterium]
MNTLEIAELSSLVDDRIHLHLDQRFAALEARIEEAIVGVRKVEAAATTDRATLVAFSGDMDKLLATFVIATGAAAMGMQVSIFFTFWGLVALKRKTVFKGKPISEKMIAAMLPSLPTRVGTSKLNMLGVGPEFFKHVMRGKNIESLPQLIDLAQELDVRFVACEMSMRVMGITAEELREGVELGGVATYLQDAADSRVTLFI